MEAGKESKREGKPEVGGESKQEIWVNIEYTKNRERHEGMRNENDQWSNKQAVKGWEEFVLICHINEKV